MIIKRSLRHSPYFPEEAEIIKYFRNKAHEFMTVNMGTAGVNGTGDPKIIFNDEERGHYTNPNDC